MKFVCSIFLSVCFSAAFAQRQPDLSIDHYWGRSENTISFIKDNDAIVLDGNGKYGNYYLQWRIINSGATSIDTIATSDTVKVQTPWTTYKITWGQGQFPNGMKQNDTVYISPSNNPVSIPLPAGPTQSLDSIETNWCDSVYIVPGDMANPAIDPNQANNAVCNKIFVTYWQAGIQEVIGGNGIMLYPNPAKSKINLRYTFSNTAAMIEITDIMGNTVYRRDLGHMNGQKELEIDINHLLSGMYYLRLTATGDQIVEKFMICR